MIRLRDLQLDLRSGELSKGGVRVRLQEKPLRVLELLLERPGDVVTRDELRQALWPVDTFVGFDGGLNTAVNKLRVALGDSAESPRFVETVGRRGYRFIGPVEPLTAFDESPAAADRSPEPRLPTVAAPGRRRGSTLATAVLLALGAATAWVVWRPPGLDAPGPAPPPTNLSGNDDEDYSRQRPSGLDVRSMAVLPFTSLDPNEEDTALGLTLADALIARLGRLRQIAVRSTRAVQGYEGKRIDSLAAGREQQVDAVLDGSFQRAGERLRVRARLLRTSDGQQLWAGTFDEGNADPFALQDAIAEQTAQALVPRLTGAERQLVTRHDTESAEANRLFGEARYHWNKRDADGIRKSVQLLEQALRLDPTYARAYAGLADSYITLSDYDLLAAKEAFPKAKENAQQALEIDGALAEAHAALAMIKAEYDWDWAGADHAFGQAIGINPHYATAHQWYAEFLSGMGRHEQALREIRLAQQLDPLSLIIQSIEALVLNYARDYDGAIAQCRRVINRDPNFPEVYAYLVHAYARKRMFREALAAQKKWCSLMGYSTPAVAAIYEAPVQGARDYWERAAALSKPPIGGDLDGAEAWAQLGEADKSLAFLEQAYAKRGYGILYLKVDGHLDPLRSDPRFTELLRRVGFPSSR